MGSVVNHSMLCRVGLHTLKLSTQQKFLYFTACKKIKLMREKPVVIASRGKKRCRQRSRWKGLRWQSEKFKQSWMNVFSWIQFREIKKVSGISHLKNLKPTGEMYLLKDAWKCNQSCWVNVWKHFSFEGEPNTIYCGCGFEYGCSRKSVKCEWEKSDTVSVSQASIGGRALVSTSQ